MNNLLAMLFWIPNNIPNNVNIYMIFMFSFCQWFHDSLWQGPSFLCFILIIFLSQCHLVNFSPKRCLNTFQDEIPLLVLNIFWFLLQYNACVMPHSSLFPTACTILLNKIPKFLEGHCQSCSTLLNYRTNE